jgi:hypothetical protein
LESAEQALIYRLSGAANPHRRLYLFCLKLVFRGFFCRTILGLNFCLPVDKIFFRKTYAPFKTLILSDRRI